MKKKWAKGMTLLMAAAMAASMTAYAEAADDGEQIELTVAHIYVDETDLQAIAFKQALDEYREAHPNVTIVEDKADNDAYKTKLKTTLAAGSVPDIFCSWGGGFSTDFVAAGIVECLDPYVESGVINMDEMMPNICSNFYYDDQLYGLPLDNFIGVLMCNQELFDQYDLEIPETMEDMYAVSKVFNENGIIPLALGDKDKWPGLFPFGALALRYGGVENCIDLLSRGEGNFDQDWVVKTAEELQKMVDEGVVSDSAVALTNDEAKNDFTSGRAAMYYSGNWGIGGFEAEDSEVAGKFTYVNWPSVEGAEGDQNAYVGGASATLMVSAESEHREAAVELATFISHKFSDYGYENGSILPTWKYTGDAELQPYQERLGELMEGADGFCLAWDTLLDPEPAGIHSNSVQGLYAKQMTADDYIQSMVATRK